MYHSKNDEQMNLFRSYTRASDTHLFLLLQQPTAIALPTRSMNKGSIATIKSSSSDIQDGTVKNDKVHRFFILRHGETDANAIGIMQGSADFSRLTSNGRSQAKKIGDNVFSNNHEDEYIMKPTSVYVSPLTRSQNTLQIIKDTVSAYHDDFPKEYTILDNLREIDFYDWEGMQKEELISHYPSSYHA